MLRMGFGDSTRRTRRERRKRQKKGLTQRTGAPERGRRRKRETWIDRMDRVKAGRWN
jgi:hypothetical protein